MNEETREQIALARFKLISPVLAEPHRFRNEYFRMQAERDHDMPHYGLRRYSVSTFKSWLRLYNQRAFEGLKPRSRADCGAPRKLTGEMLDSIKLKCELFPEWSARLLYEELLGQGQLGNPPACYNTFLRTIKREGLRTKKGRKDVRKRFETAEAGELWLCDFMHGPVVKVGRGARKKAILCAIIDDHSRMIVGYGFDVHETIASLTLVLKEALLTYGLPKRLYVDNGSAFSSDLLVKSCAQLRISLIHSRPYDSPSRGKIERFFRTVRDRFLPHLQGTVTLEDINIAFSAWLADEYHHRLHTGTGQRPIDRYHASAGRIDVPRLAAHELDNAFLVRNTRVVNHDSTISFKGRIYEVPSVYIRQKVEILHPVDAPDELTLHDGQNRVCRLKLVDVKDNARTFKPRVDESAVSFSDGRVKS